MNTALYWISKYSASGAWNGEAIQTEVDLDVAKALLKTLADQKGAKGYDVSLSDDGMRLDASHDDMADAWTYTIEREREE